MVTGSCSCRSVRYEIDGRISPIVFCHCSKCRRANGSAFHAGSLCPKTRFRFVGATDTIGEYQTESGYETRFCRSYGSPVPMHQRDGSISVLPRTGADTAPAPVASPDPIRATPIDVARLISPRHPCHVTLRVRRDVPSLRSERLVAEFERSLRAACERGRFRVVHYALMRDHVHAIVEASGAADLAAGMKSLGSRLARAVNRIFGRCGPVLADRFHVRSLRTPREVRGALAYVLLNARRHAAKLGRTLAARWRIDPASSGRWFDGWCRSSRISLAKDPPAVASPRSWLLTLGWRRIGLVDPSEVPGGVSSTRPRSSPNRRAARAGCPSY